MDIKQADIVEFKKLYASHFDMQISDKLARIKLSMLVRQMELVYKPITKEQLSKLEYGNEYETNPGTDNN